MTKNAAVTVIRFVNLVFAGVFAGFLVAALVVELTLRNYGASVYVQVRHVELAHLDELASATLLPALVTAVVLTVATFRTRGRERWLTLTALALLVVVFVTTLSVNLPINHDQLHWNVQSPPSDWANVRDRWQIAHAVRTVAAVVAFACMGAGALITRRRTPPDFAAGPLSQAGMRSPAGTPAARS
jgi:uncharacterized membrane protein